jgi:hypothetical protein
VTAFPVGNALLRRQAISAAALQEVPLIAYPNDPRSEFAQHTIKLLTIGGITPRLDC